jgi:hypothetical protein
MKYVSLNRATSGGVISEIFEVQDTVDSTETALRAAIQEYINTEEGQKDLVIDGHCDWSTALTNIKKETLAKHGLRLLQITENLDVDSDEDLVGLSDD